MVSNPDNIPAGEIIRETVTLGYYFSAGKHVGGYIGYYAQFSDVPFTRRLGTWESAGHGYTYQQAVEEALAVFMRQAEATPLVAFLP